MEAKEYLKNLQRLDIMINQKIKELSSLRAKADVIKGIDYSESRVQKSCSGGARFERTIERIIDLDAEINREIDRFVNAKHTIINQIQGLENPTFAQLLYKRYVEYKKLETISAEMSFAYQYIRVLHGQALQAFESSYKNLHNHT